MQICTSSESIGNVTYKYTIILYCILLYCIEFVIKVVTLNWTYALFCIMSPYLIAFQTGHTCGHCHKVGR